MICSASRTKQTTKSIQRHIRNKRSSKERINLRRKIHIVKFYFPIQNLEKIKSS